MNYFMYISLSLLDLAWSGSGYGLMWAGRVVIPPGEGPGISFMPLDADGKPLGDPVSLSNYGLFQERLGIARDGEGYACLGESFEATDLGGSLGIYRVTAMGAPRDARRHALDGPHGRGQGGFVASDHRYVAVWAGYLPLPDIPTSATYGVADAEGNWFGAVLLGPIADHIGAVPPDVAWSGSEFGIAWFGPGRLHHPPSVWFARLSARGELLAPPRRVFDPGHGVSEIGLTFGHQTFAIGFVGPDRAAHLVRLDRNGRLVDYATGPPTSDPPTPPAAVAADDLGFGILGAVQPEMPAGGEGLPVFTWFRVVSP